MHFKNRKGAAGLIKQIRKVIGRRKIKIRRKSVKKKIRYGFKPTKSRSNTESSSSSFMESTSEEYESDSSTDNLGFPEWCWKKPTRDTNREKKFQQDIERFFNRKDYRLSSLFIESHVFDDYLKCEVGKWKYPKSSRDKVELEPIPTSFLPPIDNSPIIYEIPPEDGNPPEKVQRVCGYREIYLKRQYIDYLKEVEEITNSTTGNNSYTEERKQFDPKAVEDQFRHVAPGGGGGVEKKESILDPLPKGYKQYYKDIKREKLARGEDLEPKDSLEGKTSFFSRFKKSLKNGADLLLGKSETGMSPPVYHPGLENRPSTANHPSPMTTSAQHSLTPIRPNTAPDTGKILGPSKTVHGITTESSNPFQHKIHPGVLHQPGVLQGSHSAPVNIAFQKYQKQVLVGKVDRYGNYIGPELPERGDEWLALSDSEEDHKEIKSFNKKHASWMDEKLSYESQFLVREMGWLIKGLRATGRCFFFTEPNYETGHLDFKVRRKKMIMFFFSSFTLWVALALILLSISNVKFNGSESPFVKVDQLELSKYTVPLTGFVAYLAVIALWSIYVILRDGLVIAHYMNCWNGALAEMETSAAVDIKRITIYNFICIFAYWIMILVAFIMDWPANVRGFCGLVGNLIFRPFIGHIRTQQEHKYFWFQIMGLVLVLYVTCCTRLLFGLMQVISLILKNAIEMWNFKFALRFRQLAMTTRGQTVKMSLRHNLIKLFTHHRLITALLKLFGNIFAVPIGCYIVFQMAVTTNALVWLFNFEKGDPKNFGGTDHISLNDSWTEATNIKIMYYHSAGEEILTVVIVIFQMVVDFVFTTEVISTAGESFTDGFEFVRRTNLILCESTHERKVVQSLLWSMSATSPTMLSARSFFPINRATIMSAGATTVFFFSMIIQLQHSTEQIVIKIPPGCTSSVCAQIVRDPSTPPPTVATITPKIVERYYFLHDCDKLPKQDIIKNLKHERPPPLPTCKVKGDHTNYPRWIPQYYWKELEIVWDTAFQTNTDQNPTPRKPKGYCGKELSGHPKDGINPTGPRKQCGWPQFYRDCFTSCHSDILGKRMVVPIVYNDQGNLTYYYKNDTVLEESRDCGINPFTLAQPNTEKIYDCFLNRLRYSSIDICGWLNFYQPSQFPRDKNNNLYVDDNMWMYSREKVALEKIKPLDENALTPKGDLRCHDSELAEWRCKTPEINKFCGVSRLLGKLYWGYWYGTNCFKYAWVEPTIEGFCRHPINEASMAADESISEVDFNQGINDLPKPHAPGEEPCGAGQQGELGSKSLLQNRLLFEFTCIENNPGGGKTIVRNYRPYFKIQGSTDIKQIPLQFVRRGNGTCISTPYKDFPFTFIDSGVTYTITELLACDGGNLVKVSDVGDCGSQIVYPEQNDVLLNGYCPFMAVNGPKITLWFFFHDCDLPDIKPYVVSTDDFDICKVEMPESKWIRDELKLPFRVLNTTTQYNEVIFQWSLPFQNRGFYCYLAGAFSICTWYHYLLHCTRTHRSAILGKIILIPVWRYGGGVSANQMLWHHAVDPAFDTFINPSIAQMIPKGDGFGRTCGDHYVEETYWVRDTFYSDPEKSVFHDSCGWIGMANMASSGGRNTTVNVRKLQYLPVPKIAVSIPNYGVNGERLPNQTIWCWNDPFALDRCRHPKINPYCQRNPMWRNEPQLRDFSVLMRYQHRTDWQNNKFKKVYRYGAACLQSLHVMPDDNGFCEGVYPEKWAEEAPRRNNWPNPLLTEAEFDRKNDLEKIIFNTNSPCSEPDLVKFQNYPTPPGPTTLRSLLQFDHFLHVHCVTVLPGGRGITMTKVVHPFYRSTWDNRLRMLPSSVLLPWKDIHKCKVGELYPTLPVTIDEPILGVTRTRRVTITSYLGCNGNTITLL